MGKISSAQKSYKCVGVASMLCAKLVTCIIQWPLLLSQLQCIEVLTFVYHSYILIYLLNTRLILNYEDILQKSRFALQFNHLRAAHLWAGHCKVKICLLLASIDVCTLFLSEVSLKERRCIDINTKLVSKATKYMLQVSELCVLF